MKKIGILGGVAWLSTVEYYTGICRRSEKWQHTKNPTTPPSTPEMCIESLDINKAISYLGNDADEGSWRCFDEYHRAGLRRLETSGADFAVIASNTPHHRFTQIVCGVGIPVINIFEVVAEECAKIGAKQILILGTALTMTSEIFRDWFAKYGIEAAGPSAGEMRIQIIDLIAELQLGKFGGVTSRIQSIAQHAFTQQFTGPPVVCLACTELPLAFPGANTLRAFELGGITYVNAAAVHMDAAFVYASNF